MNYRPICDTWILGRPKVKYYGAFPRGFLHRARQVMNVGTAPILFICGGKVREYPFRGFGSLDMTLDLDPACKPDFLQDARLPYPKNPHSGISGPAPNWGGVVIDRPYSPEDATHYMPGADMLPTANQLVKSAMDVLAPGGCVGMLDYIWPQPPKNATEVCVISVLMGRNNRARLFTVFEKMRATA